MEGEQTNKRVIILGIVLFVVLMGVMYFMSLEQRDALQQQGALTESQYGSEIAVIEERNQLTPEEMMSLLEYREEARRVAALQEAGGDVVPSDEVIEDIDNLDE